MLIYQKYFVEHLVTIGDRMTLKIFKEADQEEDDERF
jgi:hypothetical protein